MKQAHVGKISKVKLAAVGMMFALGLNLVATQAHAQDQTSSFNKESAIGAVLGGVVGNQMGKGFGKVLATVGGAVAGGVIGNEMNKAHEQKAQYEASVLSSPMRNYAPATFDQWERGGAQANTSMKTKVAMQRITQDMKSTYDQTYFAEKAFDEKQKEMNSRGYQRNPSYGTPNWKGPDQVRYEMEQAQRLHAANIMKALDVLEMAAAHGEDVGPYRATMEKNMSVDVGDWVLNHPLTGVQVEVKTKNQPRY